MAPLTRLVIRPPVEYDHCAAYAVVDASHPVAVAFAGATLPHVGVEASATVHAPDKRLNPSYVKHSAVTRPLAAVPSATGTSLVEVVILPITSLVNESFCTNTVCAETPTRSSQTTPTGPSRPS